MMNWPVDHIAIATADLDQGSQPYVTLGFSAVGEDEDVEEQNVRVRVFQSGDSLIEVLAPTSPDSPIAKFLNTRGPGLHHIAFRVDDLDAECVRLSAEGALLTPKPQSGRGGTRVVFLHPKWGQGTLIELIEHPTQ